MKQLAAVLAAILSLTLVAPALAQPFADVPTDHWAYDAIAELAAKGLIEGYPDGAFRGDRAATRYELAMVVARLLARIEAIKIPPLPADLVRTPQLNAANAANTAALRAVDQRLTAKLATIQRLVAEFRAELAALGVRVTAVEEELAALRARLDNTKVTGNMRYRYNFFPSNAASGGATQRSPDARLRAAIQFTGSAGPNTTAVVRLRANNQANASGNFTDVSFGNGGVWNNVGFDYLYIDVRNTWGANLWRLGRQAYSIGDQYGGGLGGGLLHDPADSAGSTCGGFLTPGTTVPGPLPACTPGTSDGLRSDWTLGPLNVEVGLWRSNFTSSGPGVGVRSPYFDEKTLRVTTGALLPGWTLGGTYYDQSNFGFTATGVAPFLGGAQAGKGYGFDLNGTLMPGLTLYIDWVSWQARVQNSAGTVFTWPTATAWRVGGNLDLAKVAGITTWSPSIDFAYNNFGPLPSDPTFGVAPPPLYSYAQTTFGTFFTWQMRGVLVKLNLTFNPKASAFLQYEGGTELFANTSYYEWWVRFSYVLSPRTNTYIQYTKGNCGSATLCGTAFGGDFFNFYRAELSYSW